MRVCVRVCVPAYVSLSLSARVCVCVCVLVVVRVCVSGGGGGVMRRTHVTCYTYPCIHTPMHRVGLGLGLG